MELVISTGATELLLDAEALACVEVAVIASTEPPIVAAALMLPFEHPFHVSVAFALAPNSFASADYHGEMRDLTVRFGTAFRKVRLASTRTLLADGCIRADTAIHGRGEILVTGLRHMNYVG